MDDLFKIFDDREQEYGLIEDNYKSPIPSKPTIFISHHNRLGVIVVIVCGLHGFGIYLRHGFPVGWIGREAKQRFQTRGFVYQSHQPFYL